MTTESNLDSRCPNCTTPYGRRRRCYKCHGGGSPKAGRNVTCGACGKEFYAPKWKLDDTERRQGTYCSRECKHEAQALKKLPKTERQKLRRRDVELQQRYGLTLVEYQQKTVDQGGGCAICGNPPSGSGTAGQSLHVDHDHSCCPDLGSCGRCIRGLLCGSCNTMIGLAQEDPKRFLAAVAYLQRFAERTTA